MITARSDPGVSVMDLRIRLERVAAAAFDRTCLPSRPGEQGNVRRRLLFLLDGQPDERWLETYRLVHLGIHVYRRTSDVLHGRVAAANLPSLVVDEWRDVVERLEAVAAGGDSAVTLSPGTEPAP